MTQNTYRFAGKPIEQLTHDEAIEALQFICNEKTNEETELDKVISKNAERAKKHYVEITFEYFGTKYTVKPVPTQSYNIENLNGDKNG